MNTPKGITLNSLGPATMTVKVRMGARLRVRAWVAIRLMRLAARVLNMRFETEFTNEEGGDE